MTTDAPSLVCVQEVDRVVNLERREDSAMAQRGLSQGAERMSAYTPPPLLPPKGRNGMGASLRVVMGWEPP